MRASLSRIPGGVFCSFLVVLFLAAFVQCQAQSIATGWSQESLVKNVELGGAVTQLQWDITAQRTGEEPKFATSRAVPLVLYLSEREERGLSYIRGIVSAPGNEHEGMSVPVERGGQLATNEGTYWYAALVPRELLEKSTEVRLRIFAAVTHDVRPLPKAIGQAEPQYLLWSGDVSLRTPYETTSGDIIIKTPRENVLSYEPKQGAKKEDATITYGPYTNIPVYEPGSTSVREGRVHYQYSPPVISYVDFDRHVEISHWGDNLATADNIWLRNDGAQLKGHFNRVAHMINMWGNPAAEVVAQVHTIPVVLPPAARDAYFVDTTGNVSTSSFAPSMPGSFMPRRLDLQPRFPVLGGWNYTFTVGWNQRMSAAGMIKRLSDANRYRVAVPFLNAPNTAAVDHARLRVVLPEGASNIDVTLPFEMDNEEITSYPTYLDTTGRPAIVLERAKCSSKLNGLVYVDYTLTPLNHIRKILAVATAFAIIFFLAA